MSLCMKTPCILVENIYAVLHTLNLFNFIFVFLDFSSKRTYLVNLGSRYSLGFACISHKDKYY